MLTKKEIASNFLMLAVQGKSREAFNLYVGKSFKHHNAYFKGDTETIITAMEESAEEVPNKIFEIQRILHDGDLVAAHSRIRQEQFGIDMAVMHIFRFENDKIVELWDFGQEYPKDCVNENGMF